MCLAVPGKIVEITGYDALTRVGQVMFGEVMRAVNLAYVPEAGVGDFVLVHVGFAISCIDEEAAAKSIALLSELVREDI